MILTYSPRDKRLVNACAADHTTTIAGGDPVLVLDMYEHAYQMDFGARAADYVNNHAALTATTPFSEDAPLPATLTSDEAAYVQPVDEKR